MNVHQHRFLLSERTTLRELIERSHPEDVISRMSLERRLQEVEATLESYEGIPPDIVKARLTFSGKPVVGCRGIDGDFGTDAPNAFFEALVAIGASQRQHTPLASQGPIPNRENYRLLITNTVRGSFGFQFEDASPQLALAGEKTPVELAIERVKEVLHASVGDDEQLAEAIADTDRRALKSLQDFLKKVADNDAVCALEFKGDVFRFRDTAQVRRSENRLSQDYIKDDDVTLMGQFLGFFPYHPRAQFRISSAKADFLIGEVGEIITARVDSSVADAININGILERDVRIGAHTRRVGSGRPRYVVTSCEELTH